MVEFGKEGKYDSRLRAKSKEIMNIYFIICYYGNILHLHHNGVCTSSSSLLLVIENGSRTKVRIEKVRMAIIRRIMFVCLKYVRIKFVGYKVRHVKSS